ncbi:MAG: hypothetical protein AAF645_23940, partial [Myxococcota bacterium]
IGIAASCTSAPNPRPMGDADTPADADRQDGGTDADADADAVRDEAVTDVEMGPGDVGLDVPSDDGAPAPDASAPDCSDRLPPSGLTLQPAPSVFRPANAGERLFPTTFEALFGGLDTSNTSTFALNVEDDHYIALPLTVPMSGAEGLHEVRSVGAPRAPRAATMTISECPGDLNARALTPGCGVHVGSEGGALLFEVDGEVDVCQLEPGRTYFFNLAWISAAELDTGAPDRCDPPDGRDECRQDFRRFRR